MAVAGACSGDALPAVTVPETPPQPVGVRSGSAAPRRTAFVELFVGRAMLSEAVQEAGGFVVIMPCDLYTTDGADLRDQAVLARVVDRLEKDASWVHLAPPCRTYSQARRRAKVLRTAAHPEGHGDDPDLAEANELAKITFAFAEPLFSVETRSRRSSGACLQPSALHACAACGCWSSSSVPTEGSTGRPRASSPTQAGCRG